MSAYLIIVMGVSGCGKSTVAKALAEEFICHFIEADDFHSKQAKAHMSSGKPLNDAMRGPWISALQQQLRKCRDNNQNCVMSFSGLRSRHRNAMRDIFEQTLFLHLDLPRELNLNRLSERRNHFMPPALLDSQYAAFQEIESETDVTTVSNADSIASTIRNAIESAKQHILTLA